MEVLGISTINTAMTLWTWNREKNKSDKAAPTWVAVLAAAFYVMVVITVNVMLDGGTTLEKAAKGLLSSLSVAAAITLALRSQHSRRVSEKKLAKEERRMKITIRNSFHNSSVDLNIKGNYITQGQVKRARKVLCGIKGCLCGDGFLSQRGPQDMPHVVFLPQQDGGCIIDLEGMDY